MKHAEFTIRDTVEFVMLRRNKGRVPVFKDWTREQIAIAIMRACKVNGFAYATNQSGNQIAGLVLATPDHDKKVLRINHVLGETGALKALVEAYKDMYDGYRITARRRGKEVAYKSERLVQLAERH